MNLLMISCLETQVFMLFLLRCSYFKVRTIYEISDSSTNERIHNESRNLETTHILLGGKKNNLSAVVSLKTITSKIFA